MQQPDGPSAHAPTLAQLRLQVALALAGVEPAPLPLALALDDAATVWLDPDGRGLELADGDAIVGAAFRADLPAATTGRVPTAPPWARALLHSLPAWLGDLPMWTEPGGPSPAGRWRIRLAATELPARIDEALALATCVASAVTASPPRMPMAMAACRARTLDLLIWPGSGPERHDVAIEIAGVAERVVRMALDEIGEHQGHGAAPGDRQRLAAVTDGIGVRALVGLRLRGAAAPVAGWSLALA